MGRPPTVAGPPTVVSPPAGSRTPVPPGEINSAGMVNPPQGVQVSSDGRYIIFQAEQSGCQRISAQATTQTATSVTILVTTTNTQKAHQMCPMIVRQVVVTAALNAPLNGRTIIFQGVVKHG
ncbi:MAG TPA: hypothetical protein VHF06_31030 [Pseudonocardiaceae bacterium]|nr:hypothetical protein [Pseudonocardiaceae bacterium]